MNRINRRRMRGVYVVEFAIIGLVLFTLLFGVLEMGRLFFTVNALDEVVRRGARLAAVCDIEDPENPEIRRKAVFMVNRDDDTSNSLIANLTTDDLTLVYLDENGAEVGNPGDLTSANGFRAIRYVQMRVDNFRFDLLIPGFRGVFPSLPVFRSTIPRESLGRHAETDPPGPEITPC